MSEVGIMNIRNTALQIREQLDSLIADINTIQTQRKSPTKWCLAHKPEKPYHEEEYEQISMGNYHMFPHPTTPEDTINSISVGDEVYMRIRTCIGASGQTLSKPKYKSYYRKGVVITRPTETNPDFDGLHCIDCDEKIPAARLKLGKIRCVECQTVLEKQGKFFAG